MPPIARLAVLSLLLLATAPARAHARDVDGSPRPASPKAIRAYVRARLAEGRGDRAAAVEAMRQALTHDPESPQLRTSYAEALARAGRLPAAEAEARRAVELARRGAAAADAQRALGRILLVRGRIGPAEEALLRATSLESERVRGARASVPEEPDGAVVDPGAWRLLAEARLLRGNPVAAAAAGEELAALDVPAGAEVLRDVATRLLEVPDAAAAARVAARATELDPSDVAGWKLLARAREELADLDGARGSIARALVADPDDAEALLAAGRLALRQGDETGARGWFQQLLRVASDERTAQLRVASSWLESKRPAEALAVVGSGDTPEELYLRAVALGRLRRWADAEAVLAQMGPASDELRSASCALRGHALSRLGRHDAAIGLLRDGLAQAPRDTVLLFALGEAYDRAGDRASALAQMRAVLKVAPTHAEAMNYLGYGYAEGGERLDEAETLLRAALRAEPDNPSYLDSLGWILYKRQQFGGAVEALERAAALAPELTILDHLGDAYRAVERPADAAGAWRRALQAGDPDEDEPGLTTAERRTLLQQKLETLGVQAERAANLRR